MSLVSPADSASLISRQGALLDQKSAMGLGANVLPTANLTDVAAAACCVNLAVLTNAGAAKCADNLGSMNLNLMTENRKSALITIVITY